MNVVEVKDIDGTYTMYNSNGDVIGRVCTDTGTAMIGRAFYSKVETCHNVSDDPSKFKCSRCGCEVDLEVEYTDNPDERNETLVEPTMWVNGKATYPSYCCNCNAQIIEEQI